MFSHQSQHDDQLKENIIWVGNLPFHLDQRDIHKIFSKFGNILDIDLPSYKEEISNNSKGYAFIKFENLIRAIRDIDQTEIEGRIVRVKLNDNLYPDRKIQSPYDQKNKRKSREFITEERREKRKYNDDNYIKNLDSNIKKLIISCQNSKSKIEQQRNEILELMKN
eukprot:gene5176-8782_t